VARSEAAALFKMIGRNGETIDSIRELIAVDRDSLKSLLGFLAVHLKEFRWVMEGLQFRDLVLEEFDRMAKRKENSEPATGVEAKGPVTDTYRERSLPAKLRALFRAETQA